MPRTTIDLVEELAGRAEGLWACALVVGYEDHCEFVFSRTPRAEAHGVLNVHLARGGEPLGFLGFTEPEPEHRTGQLLLQVLQEYEDQEWVRKLLLRLADRTRVLAKGGQQTPSVS